MHFKPATRSHIIPLIGIFGKSATGKTFSALRMMRGLIGPKGKLAVLDTENKRASINFDRIPGGFLALDFEPPFTPDRYCEFIQIAHDEKIDGLVIDSASHEWCGAGGYLEMKEQWLDRVAGKDYAKRNKMALAAAANCKPAHNRFVNCLLRAGIPIILCFRGKDKVKMEKVPQNNGGEKLEIIQPDHSSPIQDSELIYEMLIAVETLTGDKPDSEGFCRCDSTGGTKYTHPDLLDCIRPSERISEATGERIAEWCRNPGAKAPSNPESVDDPYKQPRAALMHKLTSLALRPEFDGDQKEFFAWCKKQGLFKDGEKSTKDLSDDRLTEIYNAASEALQ